MEKLCIAIPLAALLLIAGCSSAPNLEKGTLRCQHPFKAGSFIGCYSFTDGELSTWGEGQVDMAYYIDGDDCAQGALFGSGLDHSGYVFVIEHEPWRELVKLEPPSEDAESVVGIEPLTKDKEGLAFWVKAADGDFTLVRITSVQPITYDDLVSGAIPTLEFEWYRP